MIGTTILCIALFCALIGVVVSHYPDKEL